MPRTAIVTEILTYEVALPDSVTDESEAEHYFCELDNPVQYLASVDDRTIEVRDN